MSARRADTSTARRKLLAAACAASLFFASAALHTPRAAAAQGVQPARVAQTLERVRAASPGDTSFDDAHALAAALLREGRFAEALEIYNAILGKGGFDVDALYGAALASFNLGRAAESEALARRALGVARQALYTSGDARRVTGDAKAREVDALVLLAVVLAVRGDRAASLDSARRAAELAPAHFDAQLAYGRALYGSGDNAGAVRAFRAAVSLRPGDARARFFLASALERSGDSDAALAVYRELAARHPRAAEGHLGLGVLLVKRGGREAEEGLRELAAALEIDPNLFEARVTLGRALLARGRAGEAVEHLRRAAELAPGNPEPHYQLSLAYRRLGMRKEAAAESAIVKRIHESRRAPSGANPTTRP